MQGRSLRITIITCAGIAAFLAALLVYAHAFGPVGEIGEQAEFVVTPGETMNEIALRLKEQGLIRYEWPFRVAYVRSAGMHEVRPGGYKLTSTMDVWSVGSTLAKSPYLAWVVIRPGLRKEQVVNVLAQNLSWTESQKQEWLAVEASHPTSLREGVYFPDTYLIPSDQSPAQVSARIRERFSQVFQPYADEATRKGIKWSAVLTIASLIEREAGRSDRKLIAGIIWNRLDRNMKLQIDASLQYIKGNQEIGWWPVVKSEDKYLESVFNTYQHTGLPPHPIASPSIASIDAVLNPDTTKCLFYLHDNNGQIHCSPNYAGQLSNVNKYLK
jgi:UPF0755 protein